MLSSCGMKQGALGAAMLAVLLLLLGENLPVVWALQIPVTFLIVRGWGGWWRVLWGQQLVIIVWAVVIYLQATDPNEQGSVFMVGIVFFLINAVLSTAVGATATLMAAWPRNRGVESGTR